MQDYRRNTTVTIIVACSIITLIFFSLAMERVAQAQHEAREVMQVERARATSQHKLFDSYRALLESELEMVKNALSHSEGKTFDDVSQQAAAEVMPRVQLFLNGESELDLKRVEYLTGAQYQLPKNGWFWPAELEQRASEIATIPGVDTENFKHLLGELVADLRALDAAHNQWQAEQDRLAQEAAAEQARQEEARLASERAAQARSYFDPESYIRALAPNAVINWESGLCSENYVCGHAHLTGNQDSVITISLDPAKRSLYSSYDGIYVLVHEAAHARQWAVYGPTYYIALAPISGLSGLSAAEYMADCSTIAKIGYSAGPYTRSCTSEQMAEAARIW